MLVTVGNTSLASVCLRSGDVLAATEATEIDTIKWKAAVSAYEKGASKHGRWILWATWNEAASRWI